MEPTEYFKRRLKEPDREGITAELCEEVVREAEYTEVQEDGRVRFWGYVPERRLWLRVVTLHDRERLFNAFWDENFTRKRRRGS